MNRQSVPFRTLPTYLYVRASNGTRRVRRAVTDVLAGESNEAGLSKLAVTVILLAVAVALTLAVVAIIAPEIIGLAERTGGQIESVPLDWGQ